MVTQSHGSLSVIGYLLHTARYFLHSARFHHYKAASAGRSRPFNSINRLPSKDQEPTGTTLPRCRLPWKLAAAANPPQPAAWNVLEVVSPTAVEPNVAALVPANAVTMSPPRLPDAPLLRQDADAILPRLAAPTVRMVARPTAAVKIVAVSRVAVAAKSQARRHLHQSALEQATSSDLFS